MKYVTTILAVTAVLALAGPAWADWDPGDGHKMHYPQLPDPQGWDVNFTEPKILADDWRCTQSGPVSDIHFWFSSRYDEPFELLNVHASIHDDDLSNPDFSQPGELLWQHDFDMSQFTVRDWGTGQQGWFDPNTGEVYQEDHFMIFQCNIEGIDDPFPQVEGKIYWLDLTVFGIGPLGQAELGWKTSMDHFRDDAVWSDFGTAESWVPLYDPFTGETLDLAFVITPEPGTMALLAIGGVAVLLRRRRR